METVDLQRWEKKRKATVRVFIFESLLLGMEYSLIFLTLWVYLTTLVKTDQPRGFYSLVSAAYLLSSIVFSTIIARWVDKTRSVRITFLVCNCFVIIGNLFYVVHHSPWFLVVGRFLAGVGGPMRSVISGEIARCFPPDEQARKFSANGMAFAMGFVIGPGINFFFKDVNIKFSIFHITAVNVPGVYMAVFFLIAQAYVLFAVHDISKEYDLKAFDTHEIIKDIDDKQLCAATFLENEETAHKRFSESKSLRCETSKPRNDIEFDEKNDHQDCILMNSECMESFAIDDMDESKTPLLQTKSNQTSFDTLKATKVTSILLQNVKNVDVAFIHFLTLTMYFWTVALDMWQPMMAIDVLHMNFTELNDIVFGSGCISAFVFLLFIYKQFSDKALFTWSLVAVLSLALMEAIFASMKLIPTDWYVNIVLWMIWVTLYAIVMLVDEVFLVGVLAKMTASPIQTFNESLRLSIGYFGALIALLTSTVLFDYVEYMCLVGIIVSILAFFVLLLRRKSFQHPKLTIR